MAQPDFAAVKVARVQAYSAYLQKLVDDGAHPRDIAKLQRYRGALASAQTWGDDLEELKIYHKKDNP